MDDVAQLEKALAERYVESVRVRAVTDFTFAPARKDHYHKNSWTRAKRRGSRSKVSRPRSTGCKPRFGESLGSQLNRMHVDVCCGTVNRPAEGSERHRIVFVVRMLPSCRLAIDCGPCRLLVLARGNHTASTRAVRSRGGTRKPIVNILRFRHPSMSCFQLRSRSHMHDIDPHQNLGSDGVVGPELQKAGLTLGTEVATLRPLSLS